MNFFPGNLRGIFSRIPLFVDRLIVDSLARTIRFHEKAILSIGNRSFKRGQAMQLGQLERSLLEDDLWSIYAETTPLHRDSLGARVDPKRFTPTVIRSLQPLSNEVPQSHCHPYPASIADAHIQ